MNNQKTKVIQMPLPRNLVRWLLVAVIGLVLLNILSFFLGHLLPTATAKLVAERFSMDAELTVPAWFSSMLLALAATLLYSTAIQAYRTNDRFHRHWLFLAAIFAMMSIDEASSFHELLTLPLRDRLNLTGVLYSAWVLPVGIICLTLAAAYLPMVLALPAKLRNRLILAGGLYVGGALGLELIGGALAESLPINEVLYFGVMTLEETLEMLGVITLIDALIEHLRPLHTADTVRSQQPSSTHPATAAARTASATRD